ncbi:MAG: sugar phosphate nucleotidyltransferase [Acidobacteria bacterium]|nr:sugar phosphate nucleotidyltransferase [Acidobacteriota bacterium]
MSTKAVILAAGRGTRMKGLTADCPKPMLPLNGRPMLCHVIEAMEAAGVTEILLIVGYKAAMVESYFDAHPPARARLSYKPQPSQDGTGSAALLARDFSVGEPFLLTFGDIIVDTSVYSGLLDNAEGAEAVLALKRVDDPYRGAAVYVNDGLISRIIEKPPQGASTTPWVNAGVYLFRSSIFEELDRIPLSPRGEYELTDAIHQLLAAGKSLRWLEIKGHWRDVGRPEDLPDAERSLR